MAELLPLERPGVVDDFATVLSPYAFSERGNPLAVSIEPAPMAGIAPLPLRAPLQRQVPIQPVAQPPPDPSAPPRFQPLYTGSQWDAMIRTQPQEVVRQRVADEEARLAAYDRAVQQWQFQQQALKLRALQEAQTQKQAIAPMGLALERIEEILPSHPGNPAKADAAKQELRKRYVRSAQLVKQDPSGYFAPNISQILLGDTNKLAKAESAADDLNERKTILDAAEREYQMLEAEKFKQLQNAALLGYHQIPGGLTNATIGAGVTFKTAPRTNAPAITKPTISPEERQRMKAQFEQARKAGVSEETLKAFRLRWGLD